MSVQQEKFKEIADAIRENTGTSDLIKPSEFASKIADVYKAGQNSGGSGGYDDGFADGKKAEQDAFWDAYQDKGDRRNYTYAFYQSGWIDDIYHPKYPIIGSGACGYMYAYSGVTDTIVPIEVYHKTSTALFQNSSIKTIRSLKVVEGGSFTNWFVQCGDLENITFTEDSVIGNNISFSSCKNLTHTSLLSILNTLADKSADTSGADFVCTLGTDNLNKLSDAEKAIATGKGWVLA